jgi:K+-sensing histidine kinase KdpD
VVLSAAASGDTVVLKVTDTGPGLDEDEARRIFRRFEHGEMRSERVFKSAGLGLYNASLFVERHGGRIHVESRGAEGGAVFAITLPTRAPTRVGHDRRADGAGGLGRHPSPRRLEDVAPRRGAELLVAGTSSHSSC